MAIANGQNQQNTYTVSTEDDIGFFLLFFLNQHHTLKCKWQSIRGIKFLCPGPRLLTALKDSNTDWRGWLSCSDASPVRLQGRHYRTTAGIAPLGWVSREVLIGLYLWPQLPKGNAETLHTDWKSRYSLCGTTSEQINNPFLSMDALRSVLMKFLCHLVRYSI